MTQQEAAALWAWQELRALTPAERIRILVERAMLPPNNDNRDLVEVVREEMAR